MAVYFVAAVIARVAGWYVGHGSDSGNAYLVDFVDIARNLQSGQGLVFGLYHSANSEIAYRYAAARPPVYPLVVALLFWGGSGFVLAVFQAAAGGGTAVCSYLLGRELFSQKVALVAGALTALYPYYVWHDTALQETGLFTFLVAIGVLALVRARTRTSLVWVGVAGVALGLAVLTRATVAPFVALCPVWAAVFVGVEWRRRFSAAGLLGATVLLVVGPWMIRNFVVVGRPVVTSLTGYLLWVGNNEYTFSRYPEESIDLSRDVAAAHLTSEEAEDLLRSSRNEITESDWYSHRAVAYMRSHVQETLLSAVRKVRVAFSWRFSPRRGTFEQLVYFLSYTPILILGAVGAFLARREWRECVPVYLLVASFVCVTAVFWSHTAHRTFLDVYLIVFAASALERAGPYLAGRPRVRIADMFCDPSSDRRCNTSRVAE